MFSFFFEIVPDYSAIRGSDVLRLRNTSARIQHREFVVFAILGFNDRSHTQRYLSFRIRVRGLSKALAANQIGCLNVLQQSLDIQLNSIFHYIR